MINHYLLSSSRLVGCIQPALSNTT